MPTIQETATGETQLAAALAAGVDNISYSATVTFDKYVRVVLPLDGFVFWVRAGLVPPAGSIPDQTLTAAGSLHFSSTKAQAEDNSATVNSVIFTTETAIDDLDGIAPTTMFIGTFMGAQFAFRERYKYYQQSGLFHYRGDAINANFRSQLISDVDDLTAQTQYVSNSLPIWLSLNALAPVFPSFAVPLNQAPPYVAVHIDPANTRALQALPLKDPTGTHWQLVHDTVKFTLYGLDNDQALDFQDYILAPAYDDAGPFGLMSLPVMVDEKMTSAEFQILAAKKTMSMEVSYYQARVQSIVRQLIESVTVQFQVA